MNDVDIPKAKEVVISVADVSSIEELEDFIDNPFQNISVLPCAINTNQDFLKSTPLRLNIDNDSSTVDTKKTTFV